MSEALTKQQLIRMAWLTELRRQGYRKCEGVAAKGTRVCALGLLGELTGALDRETEKLCGVELTNCSGLTERQLELVWYMNDGVYVHKHTFAEIADKVEGWFK